MTMIPKIRFSEFEEEWEKTKLEDLLIVNSGKDYKHLKEGNIPVYGTGGYMLSVDQSLSSSDAIGIGRKGTIDKPQFLKAPFWTVDTLFFLTLRKNDDLKFLYNLAQKLDWRKYDESTGVPSLSKSNIINIEVATPTLSEQRALSHFFTLIDERIRLEGERLASLRQVKAASLQSFFPQEGEKEPRVRFKGFSGEWKKVRLSECLEISTERNLDNFYRKNDVLSVSEELGVRNQIELLGRSYAGQSVTNYNVLRTNQIVYTKSPLKVKPYGIVKVNKGETGIVSVLYAVYNVKEGISPDYIHWYFTPNFRLNNYLHPLVNKGAKNTMNISDEDALKGEIMIPSTLAEQRALSHFFTNLDKQIQLQGEKIEMLKRVKGACLEGMMV